MPHSSRTSGRWSGGGARFAVGACIALIVQACGGGGGGGTPAPVDHARLDACVLVGANVADGCTTVGTDPVVQLGDLEMGAAKSRVVALYNGGDGDVAATVSAVALAPAAAANYTLTLFTVAGGAETAATLPFELRPNRATELRVRVQFTANVAPGPVSGVGLSVTASHPVTSATVPITANVTGCPTGRGDCDGDPSNACETDTETAVGHCGGCNTACDATNGTPSCTGGVCDIACETGFGNCDLAVGNGCEVDLSADLSHCGACATACDATNGTAACTSGVCGITCDAGFADCDAAAAGCETSLLTDVLHCGACAAACSTANGTPACGGGTCSIACEPGFDDCDGDAATGCEAELATSLADCGTCGNACSTAGGTASCTAGTCQIACDAGFVDCDGDVATGCEAELATDPLHCGACATACDATNGTATCTAGACGITCDPGFEDCDGDVANGCEIDLNADPTHCGACATACDSTNGTATCTAGVCGITCADGYADCDGDATNGCEVSTATDVANCGTCAAACDATNGTASCTAGVCGITCTDGYGDCDGTAATGCEVNLNDDTDHCGACIVACNATNGTSSCTGGVCGITCNPSFDDCDGTAATGCEASLETDPAHCGSCLGACSTNNGTASCSAGTCGISCDPGFFDCDATVANGCEVNLQSDPANCSACNAACDATNGTPFCDTGACGISCAVGYDDCDLAASNGCEVDLTSDASNCNACGTVCPVPANGTAACTGGSCGIGSCDAGFDDCDALPDDGCEVNLTTDVNHCGACNAACTPTSNVATAQCVGAGCAVASCMGGWADWDGAWGDGCECRTPAGYQTCAAPQVLGSLPEGATVITALNGLPGGAEAYYTVSFPVTGPNTYGGGVPRITFARNDGGLAVFDVLTSCAGGAYSCGSGGTALSMTDYAFTDNQSYYGYGYTFRPVAWPTTVIIRVRAAAPTTGCPMYQLAVSR